MRVARWFGPLWLALVVFVGSVVPAVAQDDTSVDFEDLAGLQQVYGRTFDGHADLLAGLTPPEGIREAFRPELLVMNVGVYRFDTDANAAAGYELLRQDVNATGLGGEALPVEPIELGLDVPYSAFRAEETSTPAVTEFTIVAAQNGPFVYSVVAITRGASPVPSVEAMMHAMIGRGSGGGAEVHDPAGSSTGGMWDMLPGRAEIERRFRELTQVTDDIYFPQ